RGHDGSVEGEAADHGRVGRVGDVHEGDLSEAPSWGDEVGLGADEGPDVPTGADYDEAVTGEEHLAAAGARTAAEAAQFPQPAARRGEADQALAGQDVEMVTRRLDDVALVDSLYLHVRRRRVLSPRMLPPVAGSVGGRFLGHRVDDGPSPPAEDRK